MNIRKAQRSDREPLGRLGAMLMRLHYEFDRQRFLAPGNNVEQGYGSFLTGMLDSEENVVLVAEENGAIVGYVFAALEPLSWKDLRGPAGFIHDIAVADEARRQGVATQLIEAAISWLREHGAPRVILGTASQNTAAHTLFHKLGFRDTMIEMTMEL
jgi:ribosomal protein S18 acetylase RimI-like enzyme